MKVPFSVAWIFPQGSFVEGLVLVQQYLEGEGLSEVGPLGSPWVGSLWVIKATPSKGIKVCPGDPLTVFKRFGLWKETIWCLVPDLRCDDYAHAMSHLPWGYCHRLHYAVWTFILQNYDYNKLLCKVILCQVFCYSNKKLTTTPFMFSSEISSFFYRMDFSFLLNLHEIF